MTGWTLTPLCRSPQRRPALIATGSPGLSIATDDIVTLSDTGANISGLTAGEVGQLGTHGIDTIDATNNVLSLTVAQYQALGAVTLTGSDLVTLADTGANIAALSPAQIGDLAANGIDTIDAIDNTLQLTLQQYDFLGTVTLTSADTITMVLASGEFGALAPEISRPMRLLLSTCWTLTGGPTPLCRSPRSAGRGAACHVPGRYRHCRYCDAFGLAPDGPALVAGPHGIDKIDATDHVLSLTLEQYQALNTVALTSADAVTVTLTSAQFSALGAADFTTFGTKLVDVLDVDGATNSAVTVSAAQAAALVATGSPGLSIATGDIVTLADSGANISGLVAGQIGQLGADGIDKIDATDHVLSLTVTQYQALGAVTLTAADVVTLADTGANIAALSAGQIGGLAGDGIDKIDATDHVLSLTLEQYQALNTVALTSADAVTVTLTSAQFSALGAADFTTFGTKLVDVLDVDGGTNAAVSVSAAQAAALVATGSPGLSIATGDIVTLADTGANISAPCRRTDLASWGPMASTRSMPPTTRCR